MFVLFRLLDNLGNERMIRLRRDICSEKEIASIFSETYSHPQKVFQFIQTFSLAFRSPIFLTCFAVLVFHDIIFSVLNDKQISISQDMGEIIYQNSSSLMISNEFGPCQIITNSIIQIASVMMFSHLLKYQPIVAQHSPCQGIKYIF